MNISIVCGYYYPQNTPRAFRAAELAEELAREGHTVKVFTLSGQNDYSEYFKEKGVSVISLGESKLGLGDTMGNRKVGFFIRFFVKLFSKPFFLPYMEIAFMIRKRIDKICENTDLLISIAHPYSTHWGIALAKHKIKNFPKWISDCGDPFMGDPFEKYPFYFKYLEKKWGKETDFISIPTIAATSAYYPEVRNKIVVIPQGFRFEPINGLYEENDVPSFAYAGIFYQGQRDPSQFLEYLSTINEPFKFYLYTGESVKQWLAPYINKLGDKLVICKPVPRAQLLPILSKMDFLVNITNLGTVQQPSKLIDYSIANRPILNISTNTSSVECKVFNEFINRDYHNRLILPDLSQYDITNVAKEFLKLCENSTSKK